MTPAARTQRAADDAERGIINLEYHSPWIGLPVDVRFTWAEAEHYQAATISAGVEDLLSVEINGVDLLPRFEQETYDKLCGEIELQRKR